MANKTRLAVVLTILGIFAIVTAISLAYANPSISISPKNTNLLAGLTEYNFLLTLNNYNGTLKASNLTFSNLTAFSNKTCSVNSQTSFNCIVSFPYTGYLSGNVNYRVNQTSNVSTSTFYQINEPSIGNSSTNSTFGAWSPAIVTKLSNGWSVNGLSDYETESLKIDNQTLNLEVNYIQPPINFGSVGIGNVGMELGGTEPFNLSYNNSVQVDRTQDMAIFMLLGNSSFYLASPLDEFDSCCANITIYSQAIVQPPPPVPIVANVPPPPPVVSPPVNTTPVVINPSIGSNVLNITVASTTVTPTNTLNTTAVQQTSQANPVVGIVIAIMVMLVLYGSYSFLKLWDWSPFTKVK